MFFHDDISSICDFTKSLDSKKKIVCDKKEGASSKNRCLMEEKKMSHNLNSIATISEKLELLEEEVDNSSKNYGPHSSSEGVKAYSFFKCSRRSSIFPDPYTKIWNNTHGGSNTKRIKALLLDYTKENCVFGSFIGRLISGHWNRHHVQSVSKIIAKISIKNYYDSAEDIVSELKTLKPEKGGSLYQRIKYIEKKLEDQLNYDYKFFNL